MTRNGLDGLDLFYQSVGAGERVVMTHGAWTDGRSWEAVAGFLAKRFEVVTWDRRGHSRSGDQPAPGSTKEDAAYLASIIEDPDPGLSTPSGTPPAATSYSTWSRRVRISSRARRSMSPAHSDCWEIAAIPIWSR